MAERIGQQLGNYSLLQLIGEGGFADVYLGEHVHLGIQAAIKVLHTRLVSEGIEQFRHEARTIARLEHPHIVRVLDFGVIEGTPFLIMSYAPNGTLRQRHPKGTRVPLSSVVSYVKQIALALQYAHEQHVIHRDIKPENLLVGRNNEILLGDFGIALVTQSSHSRHTQDMAGTIAYMAPEQIEAHPRPSSDQYSLAVLTYEWLSGDRPFQGSFTEIAYKHTKVPPPPLREQVPMLSPVVEEVVLTALAKDPKQRFATIQAFATALEDVATLEQVSQITEQDSFSARPPVRSPIPSELIAPSKPSTVPAELMTPPSRPVPITPVPITEVISLSSPSALPMPTTSAEQSALTQLPAQPSRRGLSRRAVLIGLVGVGVAGTGLAWLFRSQAPQVSSPTLSSEPSPSPSPTSSSARARFITSSGAMFGFDLQHTHYNPVERILSAANVSHLVLYWTASTGGAITSSPAVASGIVYIGSNDYNLYAFDATTGKQYWKIPTGNQIHSSPAVANGVVYVGSDDSELYAFNATTGKPFWTVPVLTGGAIDSSPTVANGVVYIGSNDYKLHALDATTGKELWAANTYYPIDSSPSVSNGTVYIGSPDAHLYAVDSVAGTFKWSAPTGDSINYSSPAVANGVVYIGCQDGKLYAFRATDNTLSWSAPTRGQIINSSPAVANGVVYIGSDDGNLYAFNAATGGNALWSALIGKQIRSSPAVANGVVYIGSDDGLYAFNAATGGNALWSALIGKQIRSSPAIANGVVYIGSDDGNLYAFHLIGTSS